MGFSEPRYLRGLVVDGVVVKQFMNALNRNRLVNEFSECWIID